DACADGHDLRSELGSGPSEMCISAERQVCAAHGAAWGADGERRIADLAAREIERPGALKEVCTGTLGRRREPQCVVERMQMSGARVIERRQVAARVEDGP